jgi:altronate dehydratase large subunit
MQFRGYRRDNGKVGVRNHVAVVSTVFCGATVAKMVAEATGAVLVSYQGGCVELGSEAEHTERVLRGIVRHPNVGAVLALGLGCEQMAAESLAEEASGKPVRHFNIQDVGGVTAAVELGRRMVRELLDEAAQAKREAADLSELTLATQCGGSDTGSGLASNPTVGILADRLVALGGTVLLGETGSLYGAAGVVAERAVSPEVARRIIEITDVMERYYSLMGKSLKEANPTPGNIAGGLTTLVEKSLGGVRKGGTTPIQGVLSPAEPVPPGGRGLWIMDTTLGVDTHATSDMVAGGAQIVAFTTGRGNPVGSPVAPVIKITATRRTVETMGEIIDFDASSVLLGEESLEDCGQRLFEEFVAVANGKLTKAEELGHSLFGIGRVPVA